MTERDYWTKVLKEAERELEAARTRTTLDPAAKKLMRAKEARKRLDAGPATGHSTVPG